MEGQVLIALATWAFSIQLTAFPACFLHEQGVIGDDVFECMVFTVYRPLETISNRVPTVGTIVEFLADEYRDILKPESPRLIITVEPRIIIQVEEPIRQVSPVGGG